MLTKLLVHIPAIERWMQRNPADKKVWLDTAIGQSIQDLRDRNVEPNEFEAYQIYAAISSAAKGLFDVAWHHLNQLSGINAANGVAYSDFPAGPGFNLQALSRELGNWRRKAAK